MNGSKKLAVVSGGSRGLGAAICGHYLSVGFEVVEFSRKAPHSFSVRTDFSDPLSAHIIISDKLLQLAEKTYEEIVIVNNAGVVIPIGPAATKERVGIVTNINVNFTTAILFISEAVRLFQEQAGRKTVAHITSGAAQKGYPGMSLYCAAKAGMENFIRCLALEQETELHPFLAIGIDPGVMDTEMQADIRASNPSEFPFIERYMELKKAGDLRPTRQVAALVGKIIGQNKRSGVRYTVADFIE